MYINIHTCVCMYMWGGQSQGEVKEEISHMRTQNGQCFILSFWKVKESKKGYSYLPSQTWKGGAPHQIQSPPCQTAAGRPG